MTLHVLANFVAHPQKIEAAASLLQALVDPIRRDPGCLRCDLVVDKADPASFFFVEQWRDEAALEQHLQDAEVLRLVDLVAPLLARPFSLNRYSVV